MSLALSSGTLGADSDMVGIVLLTPAAVAMTGSGSGLSIHMATDGAGSSLHTIGGTGSLTAGVAAIGMGGTGRDADLNGHGAAGCAHSRTAVFVETPGRAVINYPRVKSPFNIYEFAPFRNTFGPLSTPFRPSKIF